MKPRFGHVMTEDENVEKMKRRQKHEATESQYEAHAADRFESRQRERAEAAAAVEKAHKEEKAQAHAHADLPWFDYRNHFFNQAAAEAFGKEIISHDDKNQGWTGKDLLQELTTPAAIMMDVMPDPDRSDFGKFGKSETQIRQMIQDKHLVLHEVYKGLDQAFRQGMLYRVNDRRQSQQTFYGVPYHVRQALDLKEPEVAVAKPAESSQPAQPKPMTAFGETILTLAKAVETLSPKDELFEYVAQLSQAALEKGLVEGDKFSETFRQKAGAIEFESPPIDSALLTLLEATYGTEQHGTVKTLCNHAISEGLLKESDYNDIMDVIKG